MNKKFRSHAMAIILAAGILSGCSNSASPTPAENIPNESVGRMQAPMRVIIYSVNGQVPVVDTGSSALFAAISNACHCVPVFVRSYLKGAGIYEITLLTGYSYHAFVVELMRDSEKLGIRAVEQDSLEHYQK